MPQQKSLFHPYKPSYGGNWFYLCKGKSTVCYANSDTNEVIASKDMAGIQALADKLNKELESKERSK